MKIHLLYYLEQNVWMWSLSKQQITIIEKRTTNTKLIQGFVWRWHLVLETTEEVYSHAAESLLIFIYLNRNERSVVTFWWWIWKNETQKGNLLRKQHSYILFSTWNIFFYLFNSNSKTNDRSTILFLYYSASWYLMNIFHTSSIWNFQEHIQFHLSFYWRNKANIEFPLFCWNWHLTIQILKVDGIADTKERMSLQLAY